MRKSIENIASEDGKRTIFENVWRTFIVGFILFISSIFVILILTPIKALFVKPSPRFKQLTNLRMDALCDELIKGRDFDTFDKVDSASEEELQRITHHISMRAAVGAVDEYPQLENIFRKDLFWLYRNGYTENERFKGIRMGFYLAVMISTALWLLL